MNSFDWQPDIAQIISEHPIEDRVAFGDGYSQTSPRGMTRVWRVAFESSHHLELRQMLGMIEGGKRFLWTQPAPHEGQGEHATEAINVSTMGINGELTELSAEFRVTLLGPQFTV